MKGLCAGLLLAVCLSTAGAASLDSRDGRVFPLFDIVQFPNDVCVDSNLNLNGTCYTSSTCTSRGGTAGSSCAGGFGVCCVIQLTAGATSSSDNNTYLVQAATTAAAKVEYTITPTDSDICRIKFDFVSLTLANPSLGTVAAVSTNFNLGGSIGRCQTDSLTITGGTPAAPTICGTNTGQHMILDANTDGHIVSINIGASDSTTSRSWTIIVSQYLCDESGESLAGPSGCLQYYTGASGRVSSFGFPETSATTIGDTVTHLVSQSYTICFRREIANCVMCFVPYIVVAIGATGMQSSFGLSISPAAAAQSGAGATSCTTDYISVVGANTLTIAQAAAPMVGTNRLCGRIFNPTDAQTAAASVCTRVTPFTIGVNFDNSETIAAMATAAATNDETSVFPGGIIGFALNFVQSASNC